MIFLLIIILIVLLLLLGVGILAGKFVELLAK